MPGPLDTTTKYLVQTYPRDWLDRFGLATAASLDLLDADLATVNPLADKVIRVNGLRLPRELAREMMPGIRTMRESST